MNNVVIAGGAIDVKIESGGSFDIFDERTNGDETFVNCGALGTESYGGGISIYLDDGAYNYKFSGKKLSFTSCTAKYGNNIYINGKVLKNVINKNSFSYNYDLSNEKDLEGADDRVVSSLIPLRKYLCPLTYPGETGEPPKTEGFDCIIGCYEYLDICFYECPENTKPSETSLTK
jgi:hypothetical protein